MILDPTGVWRFDVAALFVVGVGYGWGLGRWTVQRLRRLGLQSPAGQATIILISGATGLSSAYLFLSQVSFPDFEWMPVRWQLAELLWQSARREGPSLVRFFLVPIGVVAALIAAVVAFFPFGKGERTRMKFPYRRAAWVLYVLTVPLAIAAWRMSHSSLVGIFTAAGTMTLGHSAREIATRASLPTADEVLARDKRPPAIYLRAFRLEQDIFAVLPEAGPAPRINRFSPELPARRTRESNHLHYAVNRRVAGSNPT